MIDNPQSLPIDLLDAVRALDVRVVISKGWSKLGGAEPDNVISARIFQDGAGAIYCRA